MDPCCNWYDMVYNEFLHNMLKAIRVVFFLNYVFIFSNHKYMLGLIKIVFYPFVKS